MPWDKTNQIMTAPLNINVDGDIQQASKVRSGDLGYCFVHGLWNKWAKYKPVKSPKIAPMTEAELKALNYGLVISKYTDMDSLMAGITAGTGWAYDQPDGSSGERYRMFDLTNPSDRTAIGYRGNANSFFAYLEVPGRVVSGSGGAVIRANWQASDTVPGSIQISDLTDINGDNISLGNMYLGALIKLGSSYHYKTSSATIGSNTYAAEINLTESDITALGFGTFTVYPLLAATQCASLVSTGINNYLRGGCYAIPEQGAVSMQIASAGYFIQVTGLSGTYGTVDNGIPVGSLEVKCGLRYGADVSVIVTDVTVAIYTSDSYKGTDSHLSGYDRAESSLLLPTTTTTWPDFINDTKRVTWLDYVTAVLTFRYNGNLVTQTYSVKITDGSWDIPVD